MALTRAIATIQGAWPQFTHIGSNSGGNWFATQLLYSERFHAQLMDNKVPLEAFVVQWGAEYEAAMKIAVKSGALWATDFEAGSAATHNPICNKFDALLDKVAGPLDKYAHRSRSEPCVNTLAESHCATLTVHSVSCNPTGGSSRPGTGCRISQPCSSLGSQTLRLRRTAGDR